MNHIIDIGILNSFQHIIVEQQLFAWESRLSALIEHKNSESVDQKHSERL